MSQFAGFPARTQFTPIPNAFFSSLLPQIKDVTELKTTLHLFWSLYRQRGYPRFITHRQLLGDQTWLGSLGEGTKPPDELLADALEMAVKRGTFLHLALEINGAPEDAYFLNTETERRVVARIQNGELSLAGLKATGQAYPVVATEPMPDIFTLYEQNVGMLTPMIAEELRAAEKLYPEAWMREAIKEAASLNKRNWRYIARILEHWSTEGRSDGTDSRDSKTSPDKYTRQKYGHMVQR
ncbi:MAG: damage-indicible protein DnaD [Dehalococcoidales bacterium]|nr:damage-indicible protein DnaD [Dehalococcoidales bacterium]